MYIFKNAIRSIGRAKGRSILLWIIVLLLSVSSCIGLSIKEANKTLKKKYSENMEITATLSLKDTRENGNIDLDSLKEIAKDSLVKKFNYTTSVYLGAEENIEPLDAAGSFKQNKDFRDKYGDIRSGEETTTSESSTTTANYNENNSVLLLAEADNSDIKTEENSDESGEEEPKEQGENKEPDENSERSDDSNGEEKQNFAPPKVSESSDFSNSGSNQKTPPQINGGDTFITNKFFFNMASMNDFTVMSYSDTSEIPEYVSELKAFDNKSEEAKCVISKNLADENELKNGDTFTLKNPNNEEETYEFTVAGICDMSKSGEKSETSSNASFVNNRIYISDAFLKKIISDSLALNASESSDEKNNALSPMYDGTYFFSNLNNYNSFSDKLDEKYTLNSPDISNYEESVKELGTLSKYATYFLAVIFVIGAFVLIIINLFMIRGRKYEIGVLTAIGMKKGKVAIGLVTEIFIITFAALIIGTAAGAAVSVPITNKLLTAVNSQSEAETEDKNANEKSVMPAQSNENDESEKMNTPPSKTRSPREKFMGNVSEKVNNYITTVNSATDFAVLCKMIAVGIMLTLFSALSALVFVMRYEPLKILNGRD